MASGWPLWGQFDDGGQKAVVSRVLHIPLSSFPSALCITNQKGALRVTPDCSALSFLCLLWLSGLLMMEAWNESLHFPSEFFMLCHRRKLQLDSARKRTRVIRELLHRARRYVQMLEIVRDVYVRPLSGAVIKQSHPECCKHPDHVLWYSADLMSQQVNSE